MTTDSPTPRSLVDRLRGELDRDARILAALTPGSEAHQRLSARIEERTRQLLDRLDEQEQSNRRFREAMRAESARRQAPQLSEEAQQRLAGAAFVLIGIGIAYVGWGTWWLALAAAVLIIGLISLFAPGDLRCAQASPNDAGVRRDAAPRAPAQMPTCTRAASAGSPGRPLRPGVRLRSLTSRRTALRVRTSPGAARSAVMRLA